jgi:glycosyltransferase involved in cell wall biosynthesis
MIAKDEEKNIARAINSVNSIVSEIVVVDTGSSDRTKKVAAGLGAKVYDFKWSNDFSDVRNFAKSKCTMPWILVLDADEVVSKKDLNKVKALAESNDDACSFVQRTYSNKPAKLKWNLNDNQYEESKGYAGWTHRGIVRMFRNLAEIKFIYPIHETVMPSVKAILHSNIPIHHYPENSAPKQELYLDLLRKKIAQHPNAKSYAEIAIHLDSMNRIAEAQVYASQAIKLNRQYLFLNKLF